MRLYPKKLRNVEDLEREKKLLRKETRRLEDEEFLSLDSIFNKKSKDNEGGGFASLLDLLPVSNPLVGTFINLIKQRISKKADKPRQDTDNSSDSKKKGKSPLKKIAVEVIGGYLKWKAIELSFKGIKHLVKKRKEKRTVGE